MNVVPCITFIKRGVAKRHPERVKLEAEDLRRLIRQHGDDIADLEDSDESDEDVDELQHEPDSGGGSGTKRKKESAKNKKEETDHDTSSPESEEDDKSVDENGIAKKYWLDDYDADENGDADADKNALGIHSISTFATNDDDPYMKEDVDSEAEEIEIMPDDSLVAVSKVHGDHNTLEVFIYQADGSNMYCHHDLLLPSFPLATEWMDFDPGENSPCNLLAMGSMQPDIEIWDLDVIDAMEPVYVLAGSTKKKGKKKKKIATRGHTDAVLTLSWNRNQRQVLASGSADMTVAIWDLSKGEVVSTIPHNEKVQSIQWHPVEHQSLLTGSFDKTVKVFDCRSPDEANKVWTLSGEIEQVQWNMHNPYYFAACTEDGKTAYIDVRNDEPVAVWEAHKSSVTGLAFDHDLVGCLVTVSTDKTLKVWDMRKGQPEMILKKPLNMGDLHCIANCPDSALLFAVGAEREHRVLSLRKNEAVIKCWDLTVDTGDAEIEASSSDAVVSDEDDLDECTKTEAAAVTAPVRKGKKKKKKKGKTGST